MGRIQFGEVSQYGMYSFVRGFSVREMLLCEVSNLCEVPCGKPSLIPIVHLSDVSPTSKPFKALIFVCIFSSLFSVYYVAS